ncbi:hypothetical protein [Brevibacillus laterosporus]|uniref:hypothetical protein n=1 Tax=Brevibacillus laterosporus TaxID=1465 RepID=UPI00215C4E64|nr:hypothetical protein [Brevibacillus laterosporus]MCR8997402.1 hypothetical protein [Brevibacillus laterosporus]
MKKMSLAAIGLVSLLSTSSVFAWDGTATSTASKDKLTVEALPEKMPGKTVLAFSNGTFMVKEEAKPSQVKALSASEEYSAEILEKMQHSEIVTDEELAQLPVHPEIAYNEIEPQEGMLAYYNAEGDLYKVTLDGVNVLAAWAKGPATPGTYGPWGAHKNKIIATATDVEGTGRVTNFTDAIGDHDNRLKKYDAATKGVYDNPKSNTSIRVRNFNNDRIVYVYKNDIGALPDAVLDVWQPTLADFGEKVSDYTSFPGRYYYVK